VLGKLEVRGERLIKFGDSWFSTKSIQVERLTNITRGKVNRMIFGGLGGFTEIT